MDNILEKVTALRDENIIRPIDLELCRFLRNIHSGLADEVLLAAVLVSHLYRQGHVCLPLAEYAGQSVFNEAEIRGIKTPGLDQWQKQLNQSPVVGINGDYKPLILDDANRLYMHKLWHYEQTLARKLIDKSSQQGAEINEELLQDGLARLFKQTTQPDWQQAAAVTSVRKKLSIISGGPGTGKTSTVVRILALILEQHQKRNDSLSVALAAPTGKAAARLQVAITSAREELDVSDDIREAIPEKAQTLHQLLGARRYSSQFKHNSDNPIPYELVIVDEVSMVDQALMSKLVEALHEDTRLILLGDKDQLASVEAGSVLGDICDVDKNQYSKSYANWVKSLLLKIPDEYVVNNPKPLTDNITLLTKSYRFSSDSGIGQLSDSINDGDVERTITVLESSNKNDVGFHMLGNSSELESILGKKVLHYFRLILEAESPQKALKQFNKFRILAAHRRGSRGIMYLNSLVKKILQEQGEIPKYGQWYVGRPVIINTNDYTLGLFNGDTGLCLPDEHGDLKIFFEDEGEVRSIAPGRLPDHNTAYALTVHKSQGSEFDEVMLILPRTVSKVLNRELLYTAITRARTKVTIAGEKPILKKGIQKKIRRSSGLRDHLWL